MRKGFTLAEVLVTLAVIGVVAALAIPTLIQNTNDAQLRATLTKTYSDIAAATRTLQVQENTIRFDTYNNLRDDYAKVLNFIKTAPANEVFAGYYNYYKNTESGADHSGYTFGAGILSNGVAMRFYTYGDNGGQGYCTNDITGDLSKVCGYITIDVNGKKAPNMFGKDLFYFWVANNGGYTVHPWGSYNDGYGCAPNSTGGATSYGCTARALKHGEMP